MNDLTYQLLVGEGPEPGKVFDLRSVSITIGRDPMAEISINDPEVSRNHARLISTRSGYRIQDLGSTNGTFVDGIRLGGEPHELETGQVITIGSTVKLIYQAVPGEISPSVTILAEGLAAPVRPQQVGEPEIDVVDPVLDELVALPTNEDIEAELEAAEIDLPVEEDLDQAPAAEPHAPAATWDPDLQESASTPIPEQLDSYAAKDFSEPVVIPHQGEPDIPFSAGTESGNRRLITIIVAASLFVICCCSSLMLFMYYYGGDWLLRQLGLLP